MMAGLLLCRIVCFGDGHRICRCTMAWQPPDSGAAGIGLATNALTSTEKARVLADQTAVLALVHGVASKRMTI